MEAAIAHAVAVHQNAERYRPLKVCEDLLNTLHSSVIVVFSVCEAHVLLRGGKAS